MLDATPILPIGRGKSKFPDSLNAVPLSTPINPKYVVMSGGSIIVINSGEEMDLMQPI